MRLPAPFYDWATLCRFILKLQEQNDDAVIIIDGDEGAGKSTIAFYLCSILARHHGRQWNPEENVVIDFDDWLEQFDERERGAIVLLDEGGDLMFSRSAMSSQNVHMVRILQMARINNNVLVINCPNRAWLDKYVREHRAIIYIRVHKFHHLDGVIRGNATVHWKERMFVNDLTGEAQGWWKYVFDLQFRPIPGTLPAWKNYEKVKIAKVHKRAWELKKEGRKKAEKNLMAD